MRPSKCCYSTSFALKNSMLCIRELHWTVGRSAVCVEQRVNGIIFFVIFDLILIHKSSLLPVILIFFLTLDFSHILQNGNVSPIQINPSMLLKLPHHNHHQHYHQH